MSSGYSADTIAQSLLTDSPDVSQLADEIASASSISRDKAIELIRQVALQANAALFPPITHLELILTEGCNLACTYCFEKEMLGYRRMSIQTAKAALDLLFEYSGGARDLRITLFGGEPTLNFDAIRAATEYAEELAANAGKTLEFTTTTNGTLLTEQMAKYFAWHKIMVLLSIDGMASTNDRFRVDKRGLGTFDRVVLGLKTLKAEQPWIGVKMTVMPDNAPHLLEDVMGLYELGINQFVIGHATGIDWTPIAMQAYGEQLTKVYSWYVGHKGPDLRIAEFDEPGDGKAFFGCQAGRSTIAVGVDGEISACSKILALNNRKLLAKLGTVQFGLTHVRNRADLVGCSKVIAACNIQNIAADYQGGCFASNYSTHGDLFSPSLQDHQFSILNRIACSGCGSSH